MSTPSPVPNQPTMAMTAPAPPPAEKVPFYKTTLWISIFGVSGGIFLLLILYLIFRQRSSPQPQYQEYFQNLGGEF